MGFPKPKHVLYTEPVVFDQGRGLVWGPAYSREISQSANTIFEALPCARARSFATFDFLYMRPSGHLFMCVTFVVPPFGDHPLSLVLERVIVIAMYLIVRVPGIP
jgi:hypothetical protein